LQANEDLTFVNREQEISLLSSFLPPRCNQSSVIIIRAPSGYGKSRLTTRLSSRISGLNLAVIDPDIRAKFAGTRVYEGLFIQKCASEFNAQAKGRSYGTLRRFLSYRRWRSITEEPVTKAARRYPNLASLYEIAFKYFDRFFARGDFSVAKILVSDTHDAIAICREYVEFVIKDDDSLLIIREAQHIDHESLRFFLRLNQEVPHQHLILEYTSDTGKFDSDHQKIFVREMTNHPNALLYELHRLNREHLEILICNNINTDFTLHSDYYLKWDGNIRSIAELKFGVSVGRRIKSSNDLQQSITDLEGQLESHLEKISRSQKLLLAITFLHVEAITKHVLITVVRQIDPSSTSAEIDDNIMQLVQNHRFLEINRDSVRLQNEDLARAIEIHQGFSGLLRLSEKALREYYLNLIRKNDYGATTITIAIRQALTLCVKTRDVASLLRIINQLSSIINTANDQAVYIDAITEAVNDKAQLFDVEHKYLVDWASELAYDVSDFKRAAKLLKTLSTLDSFEGTMLACCAQEIGEHEYGLQLVQRGRMEWNQEQARVAMNLVEMITRRDLGQREESRSILQMIYDDPEARLSPLFGYALRFSEAINEFPDCTTHVLESVEWFERWGLIKSKAYSLLAAAMHTSRQGQINLALRCIQQASDMLIREVRDQHILLNNRSAVEMLREQPDFMQCVLWLTKALQYSKDDYSDVVLLTNLAISKNQLGTKDEALHCLERLLAILENPHFGDRDIFWESGFNAMQIFAHCNHPDKAAEMARLPQSKAWHPIIYKQYWHYRFGLTSVVDDKFKFMLAFDYHPLFLSHWLIDLEGLRLLKQEPWK
jgi:tetratricopeptide (TPR) repeat protein